jgi:hypothetical protein
MSVDLVYALAMDRSSREVDDEILEIAGRRSRYLYPENGRQSLYDCSLVCGVNQ